ncbi:hypothetical protein PVNG_06221 [Plasmodium vivax North Korean]|uniref:Uncharacterized protein n=1 Tax=Plasmodium vivax North Korean TaxID=1035514 RepID=A0A0J9U0G7_PLAVI|nr:hypothetical protein PVNG_06221 [Plasmodium vivax North Korean]
MNNCDEYFEQDSQEYDPDVLLTTLKKYKGQTSDSNRGPSAADMPAELKALLGLHSTGGRTEKLPKGPELQPPKGAGAKDQGSKGSAEPARPDESAHLDFWAYSLVDLEKQSHTCYDSICCYKTRYDTTNICYDNTNTSYDNNNTRYDSICHDDIRFVNTRYVNICYDII